MMENVENANTEDQIVNNMEQVQDETPLEDDFYYENDDFDLNSIKEIEPIEIPSVENNQTEEVNAESVNDNQEVQMEAPQIFETVPNQIEEVEEPSLNNVPDFSVNDSEMDKIVEEVDKNEAKENIDREYDGASFDDMFDSLYNDVEGANHFISNLIDQKKNVSENETELAEMREKLEKEKEDFAKYVETQNENIRMEKVKCDEYIKTQKMRLQNEES